MNYLVINTHYPLLQRKFSPGDTTLYTCGPVGSKGGTSFNMANYGQFHNDAFACSFQSTFRRLTTRLNFSQPDAGVVEPSPEEPPGATPAKALAFWTTVI